MICTYCHDRNLAHHNPVLGGPRLFTRCPFWIVTVQSAILASIAAIYREYLIYFCTGWMSFLVRAAAFIALVWRIQSAFHSMATYRWAVG